MKDQNKSIICQRSNKDNVFGQNWNYKTLANLNSLFVSGMFIVPLP